MHTKGGERDKLAEFKFYSDLETVPILRCFFRIQAVYLCNCDADNLMLDVIAANPFFRVGDKCLSSPI